MTTNDPRSIEERIPLRTHEEERLILGPYDRHARIVRETHRVTLLSRDGGLKLLGEPMAVHAVRDRIEGILRRARGGDPPDEATVVRSLSTALFDSSDSGARRATSTVDALGVGGGHGVHGVGSHGAHGTHGSHGSHGTHGAHSGGAASGEAPLRGHHEHHVRDVAPRTPGQAAYMEAIRQNAVTITIGPAGTGKTFLAVAMAVEALRRGEFRRLVLARPAVEAGEKLGFLPGDLQAKVNPYLRPLYDALNDLLDPAAARRYVENDVIEICPLAYMRGRTLNGAFMILDEAQNTTPKQMQMFLTRMGERGKIVVTGDITQVDLPDRTVSGLDDARRRLGGIEGVAIVELNKSDIVRHPLVGRIVAAYENGHA